VTTIILPDKARPRTTGFQTQIFDESLVIKVIGQLIETDRLNIEKSLKTWLGL
jgi:riboflavin synthase alpha subunit